MPTLDTMLNRAKTARQHAYAPYSNFHVGVCIRSDDDQLYDGCNVENASYGLTSCAEAAAICAMISAGKRRVHEVVITSSGEMFCTPCGACRQRLREFADPETQIHLYTDDGRQMTVTLDDLLPHPFCAQNIES